MKLPDGKKSRFGAILFLQFAVMIYSVNTIVAKLVAREAYFSPRFLLLYLAEFAVLGVYAILWQQIIKRFELSVAYANKAMTLLWSLLWGVLFFSETVTVQKVAGLVLVIAGTILLNTGETDQEQGKTAANPADADGKGGAA